MKCYMKNYKVNYLNMEWEWHHHSDNSKWPTSMMRTLMNLTLPHLSWYWEGKDMDIESAFLRAGVNCLQASINCHSYCLQYMYPIIWRELMIKQTRMLMDHEQPKEWSRADPLYSKLCVIPLGLAATVNSLCISHNTFFFCISSCFV
jgi:hypothetical protein